MIGTVRNASTPPTAITGPRAGAGRPGRRPCRRAHAPTAIPASTVPMIDVYVSRLMPTYGARMPPGEDLEHQHRRRADEHDRAGEQRDGASPVDRRRAASGSFTATVSNRSPSTAISRPHHSSDGHVGRDLGVVVAYDARVRRRPCARRPSRSEARPPRAQRCSASTTAAPRWSSTRSSAGVLAATSAPRCRRTRSRRSGGVVDHTDDAVLGDDPADEGEQAGGAGRVAQHRHHAGERLERGVVERATAERHAAADAERTAVGIVERQAELAGLDAHGRREAAVEVDDVARGHVDAREVGDALGADAHRRARDGAARGATPRACGSTPPPPAGTPVGPAGTPARSAASVEQSTKAAAWSTFHCEQCNLV